MSCTVPGDHTGLVYWYKQKFGYTIQTVASGLPSKISLTGRFNNSRFGATKVNALYVLHIINVCKEDEATYFCQTGTPYELEITNVTILAVNGKYVHFSVFVRFACVNHQTVY